MSKIKLLILLFLSFIFWTCAAKQTYNNIDGFSVDYVEGGIDGRNLSNLLISYLKTYKIYKANSPYLIQSKINHQQQLYIAKIDNTSDRELISTIINIDLINKKRNCVIKNLELENKQFYVIASSKNNISNNKAVEEIKFSNTEDLVKKLISMIKNINLDCVNEQQS